MSLLTQGSRARLWLKPRPWLWIALGLVGVSVFQSGAPGAVAKQNVPAVVSMTEILGRWQWMCCSGREHGTLWIGVAPTGGVTGYIHDEEAGRDTVVRQVQLTNEALRVVRAIGPSCDQEWAGKVRRGSGAAGNGGNGGNGGKGGTGANGGNGGTGGNGGNGGSGGQGGVGGAGGQGGAAGAGGVPGQPGRPGQPGSPGHGGFVWKGLVSGCGITSSREAFWAWKF